MHAGIRVSVGKFQEVVAIEIGHLFTQPLVLQFIEIAVECKVFSQLCNLYLLSSA